MYSARRVGRSDSSSSCSSSVNGGFLASAGCALFDIMYVNRDSETFNRQPKKWSFKPSILKASAGRDAELTRRKDRPPHRWRPLWLFRQLSFGNPDLAGPTAHHHAWHPANFLPVGRLPRQILLPAPAMTGL